MRVLTHAVLYDTQSFSQQYLSPSSLRFHTGRFLLVGLAQQAVPAPLHRSPCLGAAPLGLQPQAMLSAQLLRHTFYRWHQLVASQSTDLTVRQDVKLAERRQAHQARLVRPQFALRRAEVAGNFPDSPQVDLRRCVNLIQLEFAENLGEHSVPPQHRPRAERVPALRAAELTRVHPVPVAVDACHAVGVSAGDRHRVLQDVQADGTPELALRHRDIRLSHLSGRLRPLPRIGSELSDHSVPDINTSIS